MWKTWPILFIAAMIAAGTALAAEEEKPVASAERGKKIYDKLCIYCHRIDAKESKVGASGMAGVFDRRDEAWLDQWLKNPTEFSKQDEVAKAISNSYPYNMMMPTLPAMQQDENRADVIEYLKTLSAGKTEASAQ